MIAAIHHRSSRALAHRERLLYFASGVHLQLAQAREMQPAAGAASLEAERDRAVAAATRDDWAAQEIVRRLGLQQRVAHPHLERPLGAGRRRVVAQARKELG